MSVAEDRGSDTLTDGIRVRVSPRYAPEHSDPGGHKYVFSYRIVVSNEGDRDARLLSRRWEIVDADGRHDVVEGEGVVGQQPLIEPGASFEYSSFCPLRTPWGTMEGHYVMERDDGDRFRVRIDRFYLVADRDGA